MIRNNLADILKERDISVRQLAKEVNNLSRQTLTTLSLNRGKMIQLETINTLCTYLRIQPEEFFDFVPFECGFEIEITNIDIHKLSDGEKLVYLELSEQNFQANIKFQTFMDDSFDELSLKLIPAKSLPLLTSKSVQHRAVTPKFYAVVDTSDKEEFKSIWENSLTPGFRFDLLQELTEKFTTELQRYISDKFNDETWNELAPVLPVISDHIANM